MSAWHRRRDVRALGMVVAAATTGCTGSEAGAVRMVVSTPSPVIEAALAADFVGTWSLFSASASESSCLRQDAVALDAYDGLVVVALEVPGIGLPSLQVEARSCILGPDCDDVTASLEAGDAVVRPVMGTYNQTANATVSNATIAGETIHPGVIDTGLDICRFGRKYWNTMQKGAGGLVMEAVSGGIPPFPHDAAYTCPLTAAIELAPEKSRCDRFEVVRLEPLVVP